MTVRFAPELVFAPAFSVELVLQLGPGLGGYLFG